MMPEELKINGEKIARGETRQIYLRIARLPTYTNIDLPVTVIRSEKPGPVLLLSGGLHGDEINGIEIVRRLIGRNLLKPETGSIIAIPLMNVYGFIQNVRGVPDGKDINRSFPGSKSGSLAMLVAHTIMNQIVPKIDIGLDFHTGGASRANYPQIRCVFEDEKNIELANAFCAPVTLHSALINKSFRKAAYNKKKHILVYETGESMRFDENGIQIGIDGTLRVMKHLGMIKNAPVAEQTEMYNKSTWIRASYAGLYHSKVKLGDKVEPKQIIGVITDPFGNERFTIKSKLNGRIIGLNYSPVVHKGDAIAHLAKEN